MKKGPIDSSRPTLIYFQRQDKPSSSLYKRFFLFIFRFVTFWAKKSDNSYFDSEAVSSEMSEPGGTIENRCFQRVSCIKKALPLSNESIRKSILNEMKKYGNAILLHDIAKGKITREYLKQTMEKAKINEINILLLWSCFWKRCEFVEDLIRQGANIRFSENVHGLTALHVAAFSGCIKCTKLLISLDSSMVNLIIKYHSPLHCAALAKQAETAKILLDYGARLDSMTNGPGYETPLTIAVKNNAIECVKLFVNRGAQICQEGKLGDLSPLFLAAELGRSDCLEAILSKKPINCNELRKSENGNTVLHVAAEHDHPECIEILLDNGADPNVRNLRNQSALHLAVIANSYGSVIALIKKGNVDLNLEDYNKRTALHEAVELIADSRRDIVKVLIENGANVNAQDQHGFTPLHVTALNELSHCATILISNNADCSIKSKSGITAFSLIAKKTPSALEAIQDKFAEHVTLVYRSESLNEVQMRFDFKNGLHHPKEFSILNAFIDAGHKEILLHPFIMAFLTVTWARIRRCYYGMIYNSVLFSLILLLYVLTSLAYDCDRKMRDFVRDNSTVRCTNESILNRFLINYCPLSLEVQWYLLLCFALTLAYRKLYGLYGYPSLRHYCLNWGNVLEWTGILYVFAISFIYTGKVESWQVHAGAFAIVSSFTNIMYLIGQLPVFGPYVEMFQKVQSEFQKLLLVFFPFLIGFTIGFCIIFPNSSAFHNPLSGFISALVMMTGDMNYNILLDYAEEESSANFARFTSQIIYTLFLLFVTIILMNLLVGIAVHDIQGLQKTADLSRLVRQAKMCSYIEMSHYQRSPLAKSIMTLLRVVPKCYMPILKVKPLEPEGAPISKELIQNAYDLAKKREAEKRKIFSRTRSEGGPWRRLFSGSLNNGREIAKNGNLEQLIDRMDNQTSQINGLSQEIAQLKEIIKSVYPITPIKEEPLNYNYNLSEFENEKNNFKYNSF